MYFRQLKFAVLLLVHCVLSDRRPLVYGGEKTKIINYPYMINIQKERFRFDFEHFCGGSLISTLWVLTAGHCVFNLYQTSVEPPRRFALVAAISTLTRDYGLPETRRVTKIAVKNYKYQENTNGQIEVLDNDIALLRAEKPFVLNKSVKLVVLASSRDLGNKSPWEFFKGQKCSFTGWGRTLDGRYNSFTSLGLNLGNTDYLSNYLRVANVSITDEEFCLQANKEFVNVKYTFCTFGKFSSCIGDSGAPLVCNGYQVGIASVPSVCPPKITPPNTWTRVDAYYDWIEKTIGHPLMTKTIVEPSTFGSANHQSPTVVISICILFLLDSNLK